MSKVQPVVDTKTLSAAFSLIFRQGRSPPSCPAPSDGDLLNRIRDAVPSASPAACREALIKVRRLSFDAADIGSGFREDRYGKGEAARAAALAELEEHNPGFTDEEYYTAFAVGLLWAGI